MRSILRILGLPVLLACAPVAASAQHLTYAGIPWGAPVDSVRARLHALGWRDGGASPSGDLAFFGRDGTETDAYVHAGRLFRVVVIAGARGAALEGRYRALADSLQAALGEPLDRRPEALTWEAGLASLSVAIIGDARTGERTVQMQWRGPGFIDAMESRQPTPEFSRLPVGFTGVRSTPGMRVAVDTSSLRRRAGGTLLARFRLDLSSVHVDARERWDAIEYGMEVDCPGMRVRPLSRTTFLAGQRQRSDSSDAVPWTPTGQGTHAEHGLDAICRVAGTPAPLARGRTFGPVPAGWVLMSEDVYVRRLLDVTSITPLGAGVYGATMRIERGTAENTAAGRVDATRLTFELDCRTPRMRTTTMTWELAGRDVRRLPLTAEMTGWLPTPENSPVPLVLCRIARERGL